MMTVEIKIRVEGTAAKQWNEVKAFIRQRATEIANELNALQAAHQAACGETGCTSLVVASPTIGNGWDQYRWVSGRATLEGKNCVPALDAPSWGYSLSWAKRLAEQLIAFQPAVAFEESASK